MKKQLVTLQKRALMIDSGDEKEQQLLSNIIDGHSKATSQQGAENQVRFQVESPIHQEQQSSAGHIPQSSEICCVCIIQWS